MNKKFLWILIAVLLCIAFPACNRQDSAQGSSQPDIPETEEQSGLPEQGFANAEHANVLAEILMVQPDELIRFHYFDSPALYQREDGTVFPEGGFSDVTYTCGDYRSSYTQEDQALALQLAQALEAYQITGPLQEATGSTPLPEGACFTVWPTLQSQWSPALTFFDSGEIYVDYNGGGDGVHKLWYASNPNQFYELKAVLEEIHSSLNARALDYQIEFWVSPQRFKPESKALRLGFENKGADTVTAEAFTISRKAGDTWQSVGELVVSELRIAPQAMTWHSIDLTAVPGAQEPGEYRLTGTLLAPENALPIELEYRIDVDADEVSNPLPPEMTPENQAYCDRYVDMWGFYSPFQTDFDEANYIQEFHTYHLYYMMASAEERIQEYNQTYGADIPADVVEGTIMRHFLVSEEQIRAQTPTKTQNGSEYYDAATNTYHFEGGYGGGSSSAVVSQSSQEGELLTLTCDWYGMDDSYEFSQELVLRLGEGEFDFVYIAGRML